MTTIFFLAVIGIIYFIPAKIAQDRKHNNAKAIFWLNFFTGFTGIGWVLCLVWAKTDNVDKTN